MTVSVIIPTLLASGAVDEPLRSVVRSATALGGAEILVVANGPQDHWLGPVLDEPGVRLLCCTEAGPAAARNMGMAQARHRTVLFTDDDCIVPPTWCKDLLRGLASVATAAVAAPVGVRPDGPTTAFLDYQRIFDAPPLDASTVRYLITANCAVDRTRITATFDSELFRFVGAEDAEFGYQIRDSGGDIAWLGGTPRVLQKLPEAITQVTDRFHRYGRGGALLYQRRGRCRESVPGAIGWFADLARGQADDRRQFREFHDPRVRAIMISIELIATACWLVGYLQEMGTLLQHEVIELDRAGLDAGWREIGEHLRELGVDVDWTDLAPDPTRLLECSPDAEDLRAEVGAVLTRNVRVADLPDTVRVVLDRHAEEFRAELTSAGEKAAALAIRTSRAGLSIAELHHELRTAGQSFRDGMHDLEQALARRIDRNGRSGR
ncbi:MAG: glycosyltransferase family 2 protein [Haloechinothrix sp.]